MFFNYRLGWVTSLTLDTLLTVVWIVGLTNAFNLLDNMDGLCAGLRAHRRRRRPRGDAAQRRSTDRKPLTCALLLGAAAGFLDLQLPSGVDLHGRQRQPVPRADLSVLTLASPTQTHASTSVLSIVAAPALDPAGADPRYDAGDRVPAPVGPQRGAGRARSFARTVWWRSDCRSRRPSWCCGRWPALGGLLGVTLSTSTTTCRRG